MSNVRKKKLVFGVIVVCAVVLLLGGLVYYKLCMDPYRGTVKNREYSKELDTFISVEEALENIAETTVQNIVDLTESGQCQNEVCWRNNTAEDCKNGKCF